MLSSHILLITWVLLAVGGRKHPDWAALVLGLTILTSRSCQKVTWELAGQKITERSVLWNCSLPKIHLYSSIKDTQNLCKLLLRCTRIFSISFRLMLLNQVLWHGFPCLFCCFYNNYTTFCTFPGREACEKHSDLRQVGLCLAAFPNLIFGFRFPLFRLHSWELELLLICRHAVLNAEGLISATVNHLDPAKPKSLLPG